MQSLPTELPGPLLLAPSVHGDERGFFLESFRESTLQELGVSAPFVQDNHSRSTRGIVRGMHFQPGQGKLVRCVRGQIVDVVADIRRGSPRFGHWEAFVLDDTDHHQVYVPDGFAHGFCVLSEIADVAYKTTAYYDPSGEGGFAFDDPEVAIAWPQEPQPIASARDRAAPTLAELAPRLPFQYVLLRDRLALTPRQFQRLSDATLIALSLIVLTGAAVRLTGSGLGCPDWPRCYGHDLPPISYHALIEFGNRALSGVVGVLTVVTFVLATTRRPYRRDLMWLALALPLGVVAQAVLGGFTVREHLAPGFVMAHFSLSMVILVAAVALAWRARHEPGARPRSDQRLGVWGVRILAPLGALTIVAGTAATAAGPHAGGSPGQRIHRLTFKGADTLQWVVHQHATIAALFGLAVIGVWFLRRRQGASLAAQEPLTILGVLLAGQGLVGSVQYELRLPTDMVWIHVVMATLTWLVVLWAIADAGRLTPRRVTVAAGEPPVAARELEPVG